MRSKKLPIEELTLNEANPRFIKDGKFKKLMRSIKDFPQMLEIRPIVIDENNVVLGGNMRARACVELGIKEVPVIVAKGLTDEQKAEFVIKDNASFGEWDWDMLHNQWDAPTLDEWGLDVTWPEPEEGEATEDDYEEPEEIQVDVVEGDLIEIGRHRLVCGDSTDPAVIDKLLDGKDADIVFTDPMYDHGTAPTISIFNLLNTKYFLLMATFKQCISFINDSGYHFRFDLVFNQKVPSSTMNKKVPYYLHKNIIFLTKDDTTIFNCDNAKGHFSDAGYYPSIIESSKNTSEKHGLTKNSEGIKKLLSGFSFSTLLDTYIGSGTTMSAVHQLGRTCYGVELNPKYCQIIIDRMQKLDGDLVVKINGKKYE